MGGRGSAFKYDSLTNTYRTINYDVLIESEEDIKSERELHIIDRLYEDDVTVCKSTDEFKKENIYQPLVKLYQLKDKYSEAHNEELKIRGARFKDGTIACFSYQPYSFNEPTIFLSDNMVTATRKNLETFQRNAIKSGEFSPCDDTNLISHDLSHEYGHYVQQALIYRNADKSLIKNMQIKQLSNYYNSCASKMKRDILKIHKEEFDGQNAYVSKYSTKNPQEFFAEVFSNLVDCKKPTTVAQAMKKYLEDNIK